MIHPPLSHLLAAGLFGVFAALSCTSSPDTPEGESVAEQPESTEQEQIDGLSPLDIDRSDWSDERRMLDNRVDAFLAAPNRLNEAMNHSVTDMTRAAEEKAAFLRELESQLTDLVKTVDYDNETAAWSRFRIAQTYLNFGCQLQNIAVPDGVEPEMEPEYRLAITDLSRPLFEQTQQIFQQARQFEITPWSDHAIHILRELDQVADGTEAGDVCTDLEEYWQVDADDIEPVDAQDVESIGVREVMSEELENSSELDSLFPDDELQESDIKFTDDAVEIDGDVYRRCRGTAGGDGFGHVESEDGSDIDADSDSESAASPITQFHDPTIDDHCDGTDIRRVVEVRKNAFLHCYTRILQTNPELGGEVTYSWTIEPDGSVADIQIDDSSMDNDRVESCHRTCEVMYPMAFSSDDEQ